MDQVVQIGTPVCKPSCESKGVEVKASAPATPVKEEQTVKKVKRK